MANEREIFIKHFASLCNTLTDVNNLLPYFVQENIIITNDLEEINGITTTCDKVKKLLLHISGPLTAKDAKGFYTMLTIMKEHGNQSTKDLAVRMSHEVTSVINKMEDEGMTINLNTLKLRIYGTAQLKLDTCFWSLVSVYRFYSSL